MLFTSLILFALPVLPETAGRPFMRGMVVSCPRWGPIWGSPAMEESLTELSTLGVGWVAIHPYGWVEKTGDIRFQPAAELAFLSAAVQHARKARIELFWKPHLGYWRSFSHRGAIEFGASPAAWARFFRRYETFIVDQARFAEQAGVELFAVGVELEGTVRYDSAWRRIIAAVREVYDGQLVYAANWDGIDAVPFWDAVDLIGVHAYFPLSDIGSPDREAINRGWDAQLARLEALSERAGKPILLAEIGYNASLDAARTPWTYETDESDEARQLRARLIDVALSRLEEPDFITGMFWWKWMPGNGRRHNFSMRDEEALEALRRRWGPTAQLATAR